MRCDRCGRENPDHLTFCEDCGFAIGRARRETASPVVNQRPAAPDFGLLAPRAPAGPSAAPGPTCPACRTVNEVGHRFCITCGGPIDGPTVSSVAATQLAPSAAPPPPPPPSGPIDPRPPTLPDGVAAAAVAVARLSEPSMAAARMVPIGEPVPAPVPVADACPRCRSASPAGAMYCRVCGFALAGLGGDPPTHRDPAPALGVGPAAPPFGGTVRIDAPQAAPQPSGDPAPLAQLAPHPSFSVPLPAPSPAPGAASAPAPLPVAAAAAAPRGRVVLLDKDGTDRKPFPITGDTLDIGAREGGVLLDGDPFLSARHARISRDRSGGEGAYCVLDLDSVNGVYLKLRGRWPLADGDLILLGQQVLRFETVKDAEHGLGPATQHGVALFGTPPVPRLARLCQRTVEGVTRDVFHIHRSETSLGRETADIVFTDDPFLSRRHAVITHDPTTHRFSIEDAGSSNGTYVAIRGRAPLSDGDILRMGLHVFRIELQAAAASTETNARS